MAIADRRKREKEQRRNEIIVAAEKLFFAKGYTNVTMDEIAYEAEVNKALLYYYFKNKEALFFAVYRRIVQMLYKIYEDSSKLDVDGLTKIKAMSEGMHEFSKSHPDEFRLYIYAGSERFINTDNEDAKRATTLATGMWRLVVEAFLQGIEEGNIRDDLDPVEMSVYFNMITLNALNVSPVFRMILEARGINQERFWEDLEHFIRPALTNKPLNSPDKQEKS